MKGIPSRSVRQCVASNLVRVWRGRQSYGGDPPGADAIAEPVRRTEG